MPGPHPAKKAVLRAISPHFPVPDVVAAAEYYRDKFGFEILNYFGDPPGFVMVRRDKIEIQFSKLEDGEKPAPASHGHPLGLDAYIWIDDADALYAELQSRGAKILEGPVRRIYQCIEVTVQDCYGFRLVFAADCSAPS
jgi:catechol 2,3-dioxygenase-like lactoylglutathione lyase family enzyme